jgi:hypothetical protein
VDKPNAEPTLAVDVVVGMVLMVVETFYSLLFVKVLVVASWLNHSQDSTTLDLTNDDILLTIRYVLNEHQFKIMSNPSVNQ